MENQLIYGTLAILISALAFFIARLIKSIDDCKLSIDDLRDHLTAYTVRHEYIEKQVHRNEEEIISLRTKVHDISNRFTNLQCVRQTKRDESFN